MGRQSEQILEEQLIQNLQKLGYAYISLHDEEGLLSNLKTQLEKHNKMRLSNAEFDKVLNILNKGSVFDKAKTLRQKQHIVRDNGDNLYFEFLNVEHWCQNEYQVAHQITQQGRYTNRYDVTLLINGLPLVQIELKRRGLEIKEAFNQVNRYQRHSFSANHGLFQYVQIFVISNGVNSKFYANNRNQGFQQTFYWTDVENNRVTNILNGFADVFLEPCHISKMICKYIVLNETHKILMVLRPYQYYAVEAIINRVKAQGPASPPKNGYIWHTTGSGKTLTSFKAAQVLVKLPEIRKVVFVVDRRDLDYQTTQEFNNFSPGSVDGTDNTANLVRQFLGTYKDKKGEHKDSNLIVTTIQKLNTAISKMKYERKMVDLQDERMVFIFDECHRSQFGETHKRIRAFFHKAQLFGFTGTPIFADNASKNELGKRTTKDLFEDCLHKYVITDAIRDENVLKFSVEYVGRYRRKESATEIDIEVEDIDREELMSDPGRFEKIVDYIMAHHNRKTHNRNYSAMFCVDNIKSLIQYYEIFQRKKQRGEHNLNVATIFSYGVNEDDAAADGMLDSDYDEMKLAADSPGVYMPLKETAQQKHSREKLDEFIADYNQLFGTRFSTGVQGGFYNYYNDISKKLKDRERREDNPAHRIDILLVVNMFLTGFDAKKVNTLYVDKNLRYHGLIQAYSRTNRILNEQKSQGNIVAFRNLKSRTDEAITLFSNKEAVEVIIMEPYENYTAKFDDAFHALQKIASGVDDVNNLESEEEKLEFIKAFRELMRIRNVLQSFSDFDWDDLDMDEQAFEDYKSKYLDLYEEINNKTQKEKVSILEDVDFELELIHRDEINVSYILRLLINLKSGSGKDTGKAEAEILNLLNTEAGLRSKRELIERFIKDNLPVINDADDVVPAFERFWEEEQQKEFSRIVQEERLSPQRASRLIEDYLFSEREPLRDEVLDLIEGEKPGLLERKTLGERILKRIMDFVETFLDGVEFV